MEEITLKLIENSGYLLVLVLILYGLYKIILVLGKEGLIIWKNFLNDFLESIKEVSRADKEWHKRHQEGLQVSLEWHKKHSEILKENNFFLKRITNEEDK